MPGLFDSFFGGLNNFFGKVGTGLSSLFTPQGQGQAASGLAAQPDLAERLLGLLGTPGLGGVIPPGLNQEAANAPKGPLSEGPPSATPPREGLGKGNLADRLLAGAGLLARKEAIDRAQDRRAEVGNAAILPPAASQNRQVGVVAPRSRAERSRRKPLRGLL